MACKGAVQGAQGSLGRLVKGLGSTVVDQVAGRSGLALLGSGLSRPKCWACDLGLVWAKVNGVSGVLVDWV